MESMAYHKIFRKDQQMEKTMLLQQNKSSKKLLTLRRMIRSVCLSFLPRKITDHCQNVSSKHNSLQPRKMNQRN